MARAAWPGSGYEGEWKEGTEIKFVSPSGEGTLAKIDSVKPDAVLLELSLLSHRTLAILRYLREQEKVPLIIVTFIVADAYTLEQCRIAGADHLLDKYSDFEKIPKLIENR